MNTHRRKFIKIVLIGSASLIVGKILGPVISKFLENRDDVPALTAKNTTKKSSGAFRVVEDKSFFSVYDESGEEVFQIDKGA